MKNNIYLGQVMHQRLSPINYKFSYGVMSVRVDIDNLEESLNSIKLLSFNRFNLFSLKIKDFGARDNNITWREWADKILRDYGLPYTAHRIELVCFPRFLNITFNPLAVWYAYDRSNNLIAVIGEVSNTFGQWHHYVLTNNGNPLEDKVKAEASKVFHVSPFIGMKCDYQFTFYKPDDNYKLAIFQSEDNKPTLIATQTSQSINLNNKNLFLAALKYPFNTLKIVFLIHYWALKIWIKGASFHKTPKFQQDKDYSHSEMKLC